MDTIIGVKLPPCKMPRLDAYQTGARRTLDDCFASARTGGADPLLSDGSPH